MINCCGVKGIKHDSIVFLKPVQSLLLVYKGHIGKDMETQKKDKRKVLIWMSIQMFTDV